MKNKRNCFCCLKISTNKRELIQFSHQERELYSGLTGNETTKEMAPHICRVCKQKLKSAAEFVKLCKNSFESQINVISIEEIQTSSEIIIAVCEQNDDSYLSDDDVPISIIRDQQQREQFIADEGQVIEVLEIQKINEAEGKEKEKEALPATKKYKCLNCEKSFTTNQKLQLHGFTHSGVRDFSCDYEGCEKKFATEARMKAHFRVHSNERPYVCDICSISFAQSNALKCHKRTHTHEKPYHCPYENCGKRFSQNTILRTHVAAKHDENSCVKCDVVGCFKKFPRNSFLLLHKKRDHENIRNYSCPKCEKTYKQQSHLTRHVESAHMNIRHVCSQCNKTFSKSWSLKMHQFKHTAADNFPYKCAECAMAFQRRDKWLKHCSKLHPGIEFPKHPIEINLPVK